MHDRTLVGKRTKHATRSEDEFGNQHPADGSQDSCRKRARANFYQMPARPAVPVAVNAIAPVGFSSHCLVCEHWGTSVARLKLSQSSLVNRLISPHIGRTKLDLTSTASVAL